MAASNPEEGATPMAQAPIDRDLFPSASVGSASGAAAKNEVVTASTVTAPVLPASSEAAGVGGAMRALTPIAVTGTMPMPAQARSSQDLGASAGTPPDEPFRNLAQLGSAMWRSTPRTLQELITLGQLNEAKFSHEIALIGQRFGALVTSQSFLFGAFAVVTSSSAGAQPGSTAATMQWAVPLLGLLITLAAAPSIWAARAVMSELGEVRAQIEERIRNLTGLGVPLLGAHNRESSLLWTVWWGNSATLLIPLVIFGAWFWFLLRRIQFGPF